MGKEIKLFTAIVLATAGASMVACATADRPAIVSPASPGTIPAPLTRETPRPPLVATASAKNDKCIAEIDLKILPPLPNNLTLRGQGPGSFYFETERRTEIGHVVRETTSYMMAAKIWNQLDSPNFYDSAKFNIPNNPGDLLKRIAAIIECGYEKPISKVSDQEIFDLSNPKTFKIAQQVATLMDRRLKNSASLPPLPDYYSSGKSDEDYKKIDSELKQQVLAKVEATLQDMRVSNIPQLRKYAQVIDRLRQGQNPNSLLITFGFDQQLYVPAPLQVRMLEYDENYFGQGVIAAMFTNTSLTGNKSDGDFQIADIELRLGSGILAETDEARMTTIAKEAAMLESGNGLLRATIKR